LRSTSSAARCSPATAFDSGAGYEWALGAGDFDEDGRVDLAVGVRSPDQVRILRNLGDGTFALAGAAAAAGAPWQLAVGDVDGDGHLDVAVANGPSATAPSAAARATARSAASLLAARLALATDLPTRRQPPLGVAFNGSPPGWRLFANDGPAPCSARLHRHRGRHGAVRLDNRDPIWRCSTLAGDPAERNDGSPGTVFTPLKAATRFCRRFSERPDPARAGLHRLPKPGFATSCRPRRFAALLALALVALPAAVAARAPPRRQAASETAAGGRARARGGGGE
jgi:hypothetical protein